MKKLGMNTNNCYIVPHGNYAGVYPNNVTPEVARKKLGINKTALVLLFFGAIKQYKGVDQLIDEFKKLNKENLQLVIAGKCTDEALYHTIINAAQTSGRIIFHPGFVADKDVAAYFQASDIVCLPFRAITTSGSALLALTFQKPLIAPATGALLDIPGNAGLFYDPSDTKGLGASLKAVIENPKLTKSMRRAAKTYAASIGWDKIALQTKKVYASTL